MISQYLFNIVTISYTIYITTYIYVTNKVPSTKQNKYDMVKN